MGLYTPDYPRGHQLTREDHAEALGIAPKVQCSGCPEMVPEDELAYLDRTSQRYCPVCVADAAELAERLAA